MFTTELLKCVHRIDRTKLSNFEYLFNFRAYAQYTARIGLVEYFIFVSCVNSSRITSSHFGHFQGNGELFFRKSCFK